MIPGTTASNAPTSAKASTMTSSGRAIVAAMARPVRNSTMTALQALALLNDPFMIKQAEYFAERLQRMSPDLQRQIQAAHVLAFGRPPGADKREALAGYARKHGLANACRLLLNANEFIFID